VTIESFRSLGTMLLEPIVSFFHARRVTANALTMLSLLFALLSGVCYYYSMGSSIMLFLALSLAFLNALLDGADGLLARKSGNASRYGDFLDHVIDRYSDMLIIGGACLGGYVDSTMGMVILTGILLASYLGTQAQAVGVGRVYGGIMGRADRMAILIMASSLNILFQQRLGLWGFTYSVLGWSLILIGVASHITALQRIWHTRRMLLEKEE
jgi:phosphatidylglycerophosphate synthase